MGSRQLESASANTGHDKLATTALLNNRVLARTSSPPMTRVSRLLTWVLAGLLAATAVLGAGYWGYQQMQPKPLFASDSATIQGASDGRQLRRPVEPPANLPAIP